MLIKIKAIKCKHCNDIIYSRSHYDMRYCSCKKIAIDGGLSIIGDSDKNNPTITRVRGEKDVDYENTTVTYIDDFNTRKECRLKLYNDYNKQKNEYGRLK